MGLLCLIPTVEPQVHGPGPPCSRAPRLGPRPFSISVVNSFWGNFVWMHLYSRTNSTFMQDIFNLAET